MSYSGAFYLAPAPAKTNTGKTSNKEDSVQTSGGIISYGFGRRKIEAKPWYVASSGTSIFVVYRLCHGPIDSINKDDILIDDKPWTDYTGVEVWAYTGDDTQVVNPDLHLADPSWTYDLRGFAYMILKYPIGTNSSTSTAKYINGIPKIAIWVRLLKVYDPRINDTVWSPNPALHILHLLMSTTVYGARIHPNKINMDSFKFIANMFDIKLSTVSIVSVSTKKYKCLKYHTSSDANRPGSTTQTVWKAFWEETSDPANAGVWTSGVNYDVGRNKYEFHYLFDSESTLAECLRTIYRHCISNVQIINGKYELIHAEAAFEAGFNYFSEPYFSEWGDVTRGNIVVGENGKSSLKINKIGSEDLVNTLNYTYLGGDAEEHTDQISDPYLSSYDDLHELDYDFTGCPDQSQAKRLAVYYYNAAQNPLPIEFETYAIPSNLAPGTLISIDSERLGWAGKIFVIDNVEYETSEDSFKYIIKGRRFDWNFFVYETIYESVIDQTWLPSPFDIPNDVRYLTASDAIKKLKDMTYITEITLSWEPAIWDWIEQYEVSYKLETDTDYKFLAYVSKNAVNSEGKILYMVPLVIKDNELYSFKVVTISKWEVKSVGAIYNIKPLGLSAPPQWKNGAGVTALVIGNQVRLSWDMPDESEPAYDANLKEYYLYRGKSSQTLAEAIFLTSVSALSYTDVTCPSGVEVRYYVFAVDSVKSKTLTPITATATITPNQYTGFKFDIKIVTDDIVSFAKAVALKISGVQWFYPSLGKKWNERFTVTKHWNDGTQVYPLTTYPKWGQPAPVTPTDVMEIAFDEMDLGTLAGGRWTATMDITSIGFGTATARLILSASSTGASGSYTDWDLSTPQDFTCRYVIPKLVFTSNDNKTFKIVKGDIMLHLQAEPKKDFGQATLSGTQPIAITFGAGFLAPPTLSFAVQGDGGSGGSIKIPLYANLTNAGFDLWLLAADNDPVAGTVDWKADGF